MALEAMFHPLRREVGRLIDAKPELRQKMAAHLLPWAGLYDESLPDHLGAFTIAFGFAGTVREAATQPDPHQFLLDWVKEGIPDDWVDTDEKKDVAHKLYGLLLGLSFSLESLMVFGKYLNELVAEGKAGNDKAFFDAIRIDPSVMSCEVFSTRLSRAVFEQDQRFFRSLRLALKGKTEKHQTQLNRVRFAIHVLLDAGDLDLSDDALERLFVEQLDLYAPGEAPAKALRKHIRKQRNRSTT